MDELALPSPSNTVRPDSRITDHQAGTENPFCLATPAHRCHNFAVPEHKHKCEVPRYTAALLDSLIRTSSLGPKQVELLPWLNTPFVCFPDVAPILPSSRCFLKFISKQELAGRAVLDFGSGSGVLAVFASKLGADKVDAIDINASAVEATKENAARLGFADRIRVIQSDGFTHAKERYDLILANLPVVDADSPAGVRFGLFDPEYALHQRFFSELQQHLKPGGSAYVCHADLQDEWPFSRLVSLTKQRELAAHIVLRQNIEGVAWRLYCISPTALETPKLKS